MKTVHYIKNFVFICTAIWSIANCGPNYSNRKPHNDKNKEVKYPYSAGSISSATVIRYTSETSSTPIFYTSATQKALTSSTPTSPPVTTESISTSASTTTSYSFTYVFVLPIGFIPSPYPNRTYVYQDVDMRWCIQSPYWLLIELYTFSLTQDCCFLQIYDGCDISGRQIAQLLCSSSSSCSTPFVCDFSAGCFIPIYNTYNITVEEQLNALEPGNFPFSFSPFDIIYNLTPAYTCQTCVIALMFFSVNIGSSDYIILYDNIYASTDVPPVVIYNGHSKFQNYLQPYVRNQKRNLIIRFTTSTDENYDNFNISYSNIMQRILSTAQSDDYYCYFRFDKSYVLSLYLTYFYLHGTSTLHIYDGLKNCEQPGNLIQKIGPHDNYPITVQSETNKMTISFTTDAYGGRFELSAAITMITTSSTGSTSTSAHTTSTSLPLTTETSRTSQRITTKSLHTTSTLPPLTIKTSHTSLRTTTRLRYSSSSNDNTGMIIGLSSTAAVFLLVLFLSAVYCYRKRRLANSRSNRNNNSQASRVGLTSNDVTIPSTYERTPVQNIYENVQPSAPSTNIYENLPLYENVYPNRE